MKSSKYAIKKVVYAHCIFVLVVLWGLLAFCVLTTTVFFVLTTVAHATDKNISNEIWIIPELYLDYGVSNIERDNLINDLHNLEAIREYIISKFEKAGKENNTNVIRKLVRVAKVWNKAKRELIVKITIFVKSKKGI